MPLSFIPCHTFDVEDFLTAEQRAQTRGPDSYERDILGPEIEAETQAIIDKFIERGKDLKPDTLTLEELHQRQEDSDQRAKTYQWITPAEFENEDERIGQRMTAAEFISKLRGAGIVCGYRGPLPLHGGLKYDLRIQPLPGADMQYACWVMPGLMPEFSLMHFDPHGIPLNEKARGWRGTALLQLILKGFITEERAHEVFGQPQGENRLCVRRYRATLHGWRNRPRQETEGMTDATIVRASTCVHGVDLEKLCLQCQADLQKEIGEEEDIRCPECKRRYGHNLDCPNYQDPRKPRDVEKSEGFTA